MTISRRDLLVYGGLGSLAAALLPGEAEASATQLKAQAKRLRTLARQLPDSTVQKFSGSCYKGEVLVASKNKAEVHFSEEPGKMFTAVYVPRGNSITAAWDIGSNGFANRVALYQALGSRDVGPSEKMDLHLNGYCGLDDRAEEIAEMEGLMEGMGRRVGRGSAFKNKWFYEANGNLANLITGEFTQLNPAETRKVMQQVYGECLDQALKAFR